MEKEISIGIDYINLKQEIAFDVKVFRELLSISNKDINHFYLELPKVISQIQDYHQLTCNLKWLSDVESLKMLNIDHNILNQFYQLLLRNDNITFHNINETDNSDDYVYKIANVLPQKILITNKNGKSGYKLNTYKEEEFVSKHYRNNCSLYRLPKKLEYQSIDMLNDLDFLGFYLKSCTSIEFIDPYLIEPYFDSSFDLLSSIICQIKESIDIQLRFDKKEGYRPKFENLCKKIKSINNKITILEPEEYNHKYNHDRFIIVDEKLFTLQFSASFNNVYKKFNVLKVKKHFTINIDKGRAYED